MRRRSSPCCVEHTSGAVAGIVANELRANQRRNYVNTVYVQAATRGSGRMERSGRHHMASITRQPEARGCPIVSPWCAIRDNQVRPLACIPDATHKLTDPCRTSLHTCRAPAPAGAANETGSRTGEPRGVRDRAGVNCSRPHASCKRMLESSHPALSPKRAAPRPRRCRHERTRSRLRGTPVRGLPKAADNPGHYRVVDGSCHVDTRHLW